MPGVQSLSKREQLAKEEAMRVVFLTLRATVGRLVFKRR